ELRGLSWWPGRGAVLDDLRIGQPEALRAQVGEPLLHLVRVEVDPRWSSLLRGRKAVDAIRIDGGGLTLAMEMLAHLAGPAAAPVPAPEIAIVEAPVAEPAPPAAPAPTGPEAPPADGGMPAPPPPDAGVPGGPPPALPPGRRPPKVEWRN